MRNLIFEYICRFKNKYGIWDDISPFRQSFNEIENHMQLTRFRDQLDQLGPIGEVEETFIETVYNLFK